MDGLFENNLIDSLRFAFHHGEDYYNSHLGKINDALRAIGRFEISLPYTAFFHDWLQKFY